MQRLVDYLNLTRDAASKTGVNVIPAAYALYDSSSLPALTIVGATAALDATKTQFGNASLKLTATAATVSVEFTGDPITLAPYLRWIESVYIQSSRTSITGTMAVVTAVKSYPVDISGTLTPAQWGRLYGDCDLTADDSTAATVLLTLTGCTVGDTFNFEGWQLEAAAGNTNLPSAFVNSAAPGSLTAVPDDASFAKILTSHTSGNVAYNYKGVWSSATTYLQGDETIYSGSYWLALSGNTNSAPAQGNANWQVVGAYNNYQGAWSSTATYYAGQETTYGGNYWVATATNTNSAPTTSNANWVIAGPQNLDQVADGSTYARTQAAVQTGNVPDLSKGILGKTLANIADDATTTRYAVSSIDPARKALIDFTQTGHAGKVLDNIGDGLTYGRPYLSRLNAGRPWIDFGETIHLNKHLGNVPDDTTSGRFAVANIDANRRALVDFSQSGHLYKHLGNIADDATSARYAVANIDGNRRALIDFTQASHVGKIIDNLGDGVYARVKAAQVQGGVVAPFGPGRNAIYNGTFTANAANTVANGAVTYNTGVVIDGWNAGGCVVNESGVIPFNGTLRVRTYSALPIAANTTTYSANLQSIPFAVNAGAPFTLMTNRFSSLSGGSMPPSVTAYHRVYISFRNSAGTIIQNSIYDVLWGNANGVFTYSGTVPAGATQAVVIIYNYFINSGAVTNLPSGQYLDCGLTAIEYIQASNLDTDAIDGTTHGRIAMQDVYQVNGVNRVGLAVSGSGHQIGDQRANVATNAAGPVSRWVGMAISYTATAGTPATATISVSAANLAGILPNANWISYNASSASVTGTGGTTVTYYVYYLDAAMAGGTQSLGATTNGNNIYQLGAVYVGSVAVTFPSSGSGSGGGTQGLGGGGAGGGWKP